ncbi:uncharacterized protein BDR25DRAFT_356579 [Lindgomyces ingoldianus]|uniref:Uncharacterized protein n=1 Tax=Lindgomyces ingoldianus TaxID=673940 RepID=A0ACB6QQS7_9PLEO|nr:uncharacterized protein BDR25DRAFT_356579 [Lindgomyces ingoldianus]KAF2469349.1 hypothetical protein BDR25DRAFT_356579 [Lindgomyces ingoldianus]
MDQLQGGKISPGDQKEMCDSKLAKKYLTRPRLELRTFSVPNTLIPGNSKRPDEFSGWGKEIASRALREFALAVWEGGTLSSRNHIPHLTQDDALRSCLWHTWRCPSAPSMFRDIAASEAFNFEALTLRLNYSRYSRLRMGISDAIRDWTHEVSSHAKGVATSQNCEMNSYTLGIYFGSSWVCFFPPAFSRKNPGHQQASNGALHILVQPIGPSHPLFARWIWGYLTKPSHYLLRFHINTTLFRAPPLRLTDINQTSGPWQRFSSPSKERMDTCLLHIFRLGVKSYSRQVKRPGIRHRRCPQFGFWAHPDDSRAKLRASSASNGPYYGPYKVNRNGHVFSTNVPSSYDTYTYLSSSLSYERTQNLTRTGLKIAQSYSTTPQEAGTELSSIYALGIPFRVTLWPIPGRPSLLEHRAVLLCTRIKVMNIGGSISYGFGGNYTLRYHLFQWCQSNNPIYPYYSSQCHRPSPPHLPRALELISQLRLQPLCGMESPAVQDKNLINGIVTTYMPGCLLIQLVFNDSKCLFSEPNGTFDSMKKLVANNCTAKPNIKFIVTTPRNANSASGVLKRAAISLVDGAMESISYFPAQRITDSAKIHLLDGFPCHQFRAGGDILHQPQSHRYLPFRLSNSHHSLLLFLIPTRRPPHISNPACASTVSSSVYPAKPTDAPSIVPIGTNTYFHIQKPCYSDKIVDHNRGYANKGAFYEQGYRDMRDNAGLVTQQHAAKFVEPGLLQEAWATRPLTSTHIASI